MPDYKSRGPFGGIILHKSMHACMDIKFSPGLWHSYEVARVPWNRCGRVARARLKYCMKFRTNTSLFFILQEKSLTYLEEKAGF